MKPAKFTFKFCFTFIFEVNSKYVLLFFFCILSIRYTSFDNNTNFENREICILVGNNCES